MFELPQVLACGRGAHADGMRQPTDSLTTKCTLPGARRGCEHNAGDPIWSSPQVRHLVGLGPGDGGEHVRQQHLGSVARA